MGLLVAKTLTNATANPFLAGGAGSYNPVLALDVFLVQVCSIAVCSICLLLSACSGRTSLCSKGCRELPQNAGDCASHAPLQNPVLPDFRQLTPVGSALMHLLCRRPQTHCCHTLYPCCHPCGFCCKFLRSRLCRLSPWEQSLHELKERWRCAIDCRAFCAGAGRHR